MCYTFLFAVICFFVFVWFIINGKTFIDQADGINQHYRALVYYSKYLRGIIKNIIYKGEIVIPQWDFSIGEGSDILQTFGYYVIGDPFSFFCFLVPTRYMYLYYCAMNILRLYLSGIAFLLLAQETKVKSKVGSLAGAMTYVFSQWGLDLVTRHPFFLNPMVFFPLLIVGIEKILKKKKPYFYIVALCLASLSNLYFLYMLVLLTVVYVVVRLWVSFGTNIRQWFSLIVPIFLYSLLGVGLAAVILLPMLYIFVGDSRMNTGIAYHLLYDFDYYSTLPSIFLSYSRKYWLILGIASPVLVSVFVLFDKKHISVKNRICRKLLIISLIIVLIPIMGQILNGFSYRSNRWCWAFALLLAYIFSDLWNDIMILDKSNFFKIAIGLSMYFLLCIVLKNSREISVYAALIVCFLFMFYSSIENLGKNKVQRICFVIVAVNIILNGYFYYSNASNRVSFCLSVEEIDDYMENTSMNDIEEAALNVGDNSIMKRCTGNSYKSNDSIFSSFSSTQYYWTLANSDIFKFKDLLGLGVFAYRHDGYEGSCILNALASVKYLFVEKDSNSIIPYGYSKIYEGMKGNVYTNNNSLPIAYTYDCISDKTEFEKCSMTEKQELILQSAYIEDYDGNLKKTNINYKGAKTEYSIEKLYSDDSISISDNTIIVNEQASTVKLYFSGKNKCETYFTIKGLYFDKAVDTEDTPVINIGTSQGDGVQMKYFTEDYRWYANRHDFAVNLGCCEENLEWITVQFVNKGTYKFDEIGIYQIPLEGIEESVNKLKDDILDNLTLDTNKITGDISLDEEKLLCFALPYLKGWSATVDGVKMKIYKTNVMYMGLDLPPGEHHIELNYATPFLKEGAIVSVVCVLIFIGLMIKDRFYRK